MVLCPVHNFFRDKRQAQKPRWHKAPADLRSSHTLRPIVRNAQTIEGQSFTPARRFFALRVDGSDADGRARLVPPAAEFVVQASGKQANVAIIDIDRITTEETARSHSYGLVLQPDEVVFDSC